MIKTWPAFFVFLVTAIAAYALFGSPTPDDPGVVEVAVGGLLVFSILSAGFVKDFSFLKPRNVFLTSLQLLFLCGLIIPTMTGVYFGNDHMLILRDVIAFAFLGLPLFLSEKIGERKNLSIILILVLVFAGFAFSLRTLIPVFNVWIPKGELLYLSNSPLTLFAAVFLCGRFFVSMESVRLIGLWRPLLYFSILVIILASMLLDVQRATVGAVVISMAVIAIEALIKTPRRAILPILIVAGLCAMAYPLISEALTAMAKKTAEVGVNMRIAEARAVYDYLLLKPETLFVGYGWGASFASPAVGGLEVNYTHSLLTTMALKGGVIMFGAIMLVVVAGIHQIFLIFQRDKVMGLALFWALLIPSLLYASHKSLDFGLVLLAIGVWSIKVQALHPARSSDKNFETA